MLTVLHTRGLKLVCSLALLPACLAVAAARADTVTLSNGRQIEGTVLSPDGAAVVEISTDAGRLAFPAALVRSIVRGGQGAVAPVPPPTTAPTSPDLAAEATAVEGGAPAPEAASAPDTAAEDTATVGPRVPEEAVVIDAARFAQAKARADQAQTAADGLAVWQKLLAGEPRGPAVESARKELAAWQARADRNLVKFGPEWQPISAVGDRIARADDLVARAEAEVNLDEAVKLLDQALAAHPFRADIPFRKAMRYHQAARTRQCGTALGDVLRIDPNHIAARNNLGVLAVQQKSWTAAFPHLVKAALLLASSDPSNVAALDNLDLAIVRAEDDGQPTGVWEAAQAQIPVIVRIMQQSGRAVGQARWGNTWIPQADYGQRLRNKLDVDRQIAAARSRSARLEARARDNRKMVEDNDRKAQLIQSRGYLSRTVSDVVWLEQWFRKRAILEQENCDIERELKDLAAESLVLEQKRDPMPHAERPVLLDERCRPLKEIGGVGDLLPGGESGRTP